MKKFLQANFEHKELFVRLFGPDIYAVGGFVRDLLLNRPPHEVDLLIQGQPLEEIVAKLKPAGRLDLVGRSFGVIKFTIDGRTYDLALPRKDRLAEKAQTTGRSHKD
ncbi:MAG: hypothetical protein WC524_05300, partial [Candidatus Aminicenantales bacterium]